MEERLDAVSASTGRGYILVPCVYLYKYSPWTREDRSDALVELQKSVAMRDVEFFYKEDQKKFARMLDDLFTRCSEDETISSRAGKARLAGKRWGCILCRLLDKIDKQHCEKNIEKDEGEKIA